ncbi:glutathione S-transferase family protein [Halomonas heilongjiangensis]|uniref:Glutathione S-transferase n=1 Tax=Halomonas heilongjiangensis TaxID=1387883 RepID=A0A2N7TKW8_9GAMM|nr:glutathione S-transferase family protein [Halomonas heilongjiangensis]PMR68845.1 glutathione S-transferase [Halomonas heilongjiangensis]PXX94554.1 glutathione S-transferase [Halomonas heilongjiangensis]
MLTLHHCVSARSFRPLWMFEELGLPYELVMHPFPPRVHDEAFLAINPLGTVPALFDGEVQMTESAAICQYLASRRPEARLGVRADEPGYADYLNFLHFGEATLTFPQTLVLRYGHFEPPERRQPQVVEDYSRWFLSRLRTLEPRLAREPFLCAGRFTAADVSVGYALLLASHIGLEERFKPAAADYWRRLQAREAFLRALAAQHEAALAQGVSPKPAMEAGGGG